MYASELTIKTDCYCEEYLNEITRHYRNGIEVKKLIAGDKVIFIKEWSNLYGTFIKVEKDGIQYDIKQKNTTMSRPYPASAARQYPPGKKPDRRRIEKCSEPGAWYANMIGQTITVHYFCSFGAWDTKGRWLWYYDLSGPVNESPTSNSENKTNWLKKIFK